MKTILPLLAFALALNLAPAAEQTIATADFKSIYSKYWKTVQADKKLKGEQDKLQKLVEKFLEDQKGLGQQIEGMKRALKAPNLNPLDRQRRVQQLDKKMREYTENDKSITIFHRGKVKKIQEEDRKERDAIVGEIKVVVGAKAKQEGFTLVLDKNSVLFTDNSADLTLRIITQLNTNDPDKVSAPAPKKK